MTTSELTTLLAVLDQITAALVSLVQRVDAPPPPPPPRRRWPIPAAVAVCLVMLVGSLGVLSSARSYAQSAQRSADTARAASSSVPAQIEAQRKVELRCFQEIVGHYLGGTAVEKACGLP